MIVTRDTRLLTRLFCRRFLDNDLMAPSGEFEANIAVLVALLAVPGFFTLAWLLFTYSGPFMTPSERLLVALDHKYQFMACSMIVTALGATLEWDALSMDSRDVAILGPLPVAGTVISSRFRRCSGAASTGCAWPPSWPPAPRWWSER